MDGRLARLSLQAIRMAAALPTSDARVIASRLYAYGTVPRSPRLDLDFGPGDDCLGVLGLTAGATARTRLMRDYEPSTHPGWLTFARSGSKDAAAAPACKLYVSPRPEALAMAFPILGGVFARLGVRAFKVGRGVPGLLRPDKIVAYFDEPEHLRTVAGALVGKLRGCPAQGVPFTDEIGANGLLSWGLDPPTQPNRPAESWRSWVTGKLAAAILAVRRPGEDPAKRVLAGLALEGVVDWLPAAARARVHG